MSGIRKILAGLINPRLKIQNQDEASANNIQKSSQQISIGEKLGGENIKNIESNNLNQVSNNNIIKPSEQNINKEILQNNTTKLPDNSADRIITQFDKINLKQDIANATTQISSQNMKSDVLQNAVNETNVQQNPTQIAQPSINNVPTGSEKLNQILFGDSEQQNTPQQIKTENVNIAENSNTTTQNIVNNEKAAQAVSYQVNNDVVKNTNKTTNQQGRIVINPDKVDEPLNNQPKQDIQQTVVKDNNQIPAPDKPVPLNQPAQNSQVNNIIQTVYNEQYKEIFNDINKNSQQTQQVNNEVQKPVNNSPQENTNNITQNIVNNEKAAQAVSYQVNNNVVKNTNINNNSSEQSVISSDKLPETVVNNQSKQGVEQVPVKDTNDRSFVQDKPQMTNQPNNLNTQVNNTAQTIYNEQYKEVFNDINKNIQNVQQSNVTDTKVSNVLNKPEIVQISKNEQPVYNNQNEIVTKNDENKTVINNISENKISPQNEKGIDFSRISDSVNRSAYIKELLNLPKNLSEMLFIAQNTNSTINNNTLLLNNLNQDILKNQKVLSQIFDDEPIVQPNINTVGDIQGLQNIPAQPVQNPESRDAIALIFSGMVQMPEISAHILKHSKQAVSQLVIAMASVNKAEVSEQLKETLSALNMCIALADSGTPSQSLKSLMLLYLPWLPLNQGVGFDLEVEQTPGEYESNDSKLTVLIQTRNFDNVKGTFTLTTSNSVEAFIICSDDFPKATLQKKLKAECDAHSMDTNIDVEQVTPIRKETNRRQEAKVNLSATNEMNPYLLLMAHSFIRNTIEIDTNAEYAMAADKTIS